MPFQAVLDPGTQVGAPGDAVDRFADDGIEPALGRRRLGEQVVDAVVPVDIDVEAFVGAGRVAGVTKRSS